MGETPPFLADPETTQESIMRATYLALCEHGYAGLTIQRIGEAFEKSKSLLYHHYEDKDELLLAFLQYMLEEHEASLPDPDAEGDPAERLDALLNEMLASTLPDSHYEFTAAMVELRAQAAHDERYSDQFAEHDRLFCDQVAELIRAGVEEGQFREVDAGRAAEFIDSAVAGAMTRRVTGGGDEAARATRAEIDAYVDHVLRADDATGEA
ncbi:MAG: TetR/AcrR family transcriptional regulator [Halolamina sp.]